MKYLRWVNSHWSEVLRVLTFVMAVVILIFGITAYSRSQDKQNNLLKQVQASTAIIKSQNATIASLSKQIKADTDSIHEQASCIFLFFSQPQTTRDSTSVTYPPACVARSGSSPPKALGSP